MKPYEIDPGPIIGHSNLNDKSKDPSVTVAANLSINDKTAPNASMAVNIQNTGAKNGVSAVIVYFAKAAVID